ncbi:glutathionyl-hydroquinone reductase YqjG-like [Oscarella lobularis]|uniref:glutathionyl-hydroquinone reductase YqjG-like n=1 Tax=Oscarella lobularis TaxID=121494 RepID=UPI0033133606
MKIVAVLARGISAMTEAPILKWANAKGEFHRQPSTFRHVVKANGDFPAESDRYHLYVSLACPWAHRTLIVRNLKGLEKILPVTVVDWLMGADGWAFTDSKPKCSLEPYYGFGHLKELYFKAAADYAGRFTVPILWDRKRETICNNESSEIIRMLNSEFDAFSATSEQRDLDLYPSDLREKIDETNAWVYDMINNGVYKSGFATSQEAYDANVRRLFEGLDRTEEVLSKNRYICGDRLTEADVRLFTTLVRFDHVYHGHFKCNKKRLVDFPNIWAYTRDIYQMPGVGETVDMEHIRRHYMESHLQINPRGIVSIGPDLNFNEPHGRDKM